MKIVWHKTATGKKSVAVTVSLLLCLWKEIRVRNNAQDMHRCAFDIQVSSAIQFSQTPCETGAVRSKTATGRLLRVVNMIRVQSRGGRLGAVTKLGFHF